MEASMNSIRFLNLLALVAVLSSAHSIVSADDGVSRELKRPTHKGLPDLIVQEITYPVSVSGNFQLKVSVRNIGVQKAPPSYLLFLDNQNNHRQQRSIGTLLPGQLVTLTLFVSPPENQGPWSFSAIADFGNGVKERNETNNVKTFFQY